MNKTLSLTTAIVSLFLVPMIVSGAMPENMDSALQRLVQSSRGTPTGPGTKSVPRVTAVQHGAIRDAQQRVLVTVHLSGSATLADVQNQLLTAGARVVAQSAQYRGGVISAYVPVGKITQVAQGPGVLSMAMGHRPIRNVGATTSGGVFTIHDDTLISQGLDGTGITVGVLSDSFDTATTDSNGDPLLIHAAQDVASGDLPGPGNPNGHTTPVNVLEDFSPGTDEGRAMTQIVYDMAPNTHLAFATAFVSEVDFANNIRALRTSANCDVIVDDVFYTSEPMFSDGLIAQAVEDVVNSAVLAGKKCMYFSSAGNQQGGGHSAFFNPVSNTAARAGLAGQNLKLNQVPINLTTGGFHNFNQDPTAPADISQTFFLPGGSTLELDFQWNDPFDLPNGVTTDYNILVFDAAGNYLSQFSGTANNFANQEPIEDIVIENPGGDANFQIAITRAGTSPSTPVARKLRYVGIDDFGGGVGASEYYQPDAPATFGHNCASSAFGTAAYVYDGFPSNPPGPPFEPFVEDFTSNGSVSVDFDSAGNRLATSQVRQKPDIAAPDGGNTTFFGFDFEGDGFPNFFGTSAAAPHAAGLAAMLLQKAGGPQSLSLATMKSDLQKSVLVQHDVNPFVSGANLSRVGGPTVRITAFGNASNASANDKNFFTISFAPGIRGETLNQITIDLTGAGLKFDSTTASGYPFTLGKLKNISASSIHNNVPSQNDDIASITLTFDPGTFGSGTTVSFGLDRDFIGDGGGNSADFLTGADVSAATTSFSFTNYTFLNAFGAGYTILDGFGLIDAVKAASFIH